MDGVYDPMVISVHVHGYKILRLMVDDGSSPTILFSECWAQMKIPYKLIQEVTGEVVGFDSHKPKKKNYTYYLFKG